MGPISWIRCTVTSDYLHRIKCSNSATPLHVAAENGHTDVMKVLLENKADAYLLTYLLIYSGSICNLLLFLGAFSPE